MSKKFYIFYTILLLLLAFSLSEFALAKSEDVFVEPQQSNVLGKYSWLTNWQRPDGPPKVALQAGHWKNNEFPEELEKLKGNTGSSGGGKAEWEVNLTIALQAATLLQEKGVRVDVLPATIPPSYWADVFLAIHADGSESTKTSGYKLAPPWRDLTGDADLLVQSIKKPYGEITNLIWDDNISRNMRGYYAFSWWRYKHAIHPMTTAAIIETGFLTNRSDRDILLHNPNVPANAIATGILDYLQVTLQDHDFTKKNLLE